MMLRNLAHRPFEQRPLVWGSPPTGPSVGGSIISPPSSSKEELDGRQRDINVALSSTTFAFNYTSGLINTAFPQASFVASFIFTAPIGLAAVTLSSSIVNATTDGVVAVYVARYVGALISAVTSSDIYVEHIVNQGLSHSMRSGMVFADDVAPKFGSNEAMAIYIASSGTGFANNRAAVIANIRYFNLV